jgi:hypothetical protein
MHSEIAKGDKPELTSLVGASAPPSHTPAASAQATPSPCTDRKLALAFFVALNWGVPLSGVRNKLSEA